MTSARAVGTGSLYDARFEKQGGVKAIETEFEKAREATGKPPHAEMLERLTRQIPVTQTELQRLATARGEAVKQAGVSLGQVDAVKISVGEPVRHPDSGKQVARNESGGRTTSGSRPCAGGPSCRSHPLMPEEVVEVLVIPVWRDALEEAEKKP
ncbi:MAG: hypothetical protein IV085_12325 [Thiobacillus sp.]|nr:hypothetical protein [Thiobacillus sp.]